MNDEDKLKEYLQRNTSAKQTVVADSPISKIETPHVRSAAAFYRRKIVGDSIGYTFVIFVVSFLVSMYLYEKTNLDDITSLTMSFGIGGVILFVIFSLCLFYWLRYINWINGQYYPLKGWREFFDMRSPDFWKKRMYTAVRISFILKDGASDIHRQAVLVFIKNVIAKWDKRYSQIDWASGYGTPKDLASDGISFHGDISRVELIRVVRILTSDFIPLSKLLGSHLEEITIKSQKAEAEFKTKKDSRNAYDRQSGFGR